MKLSRDEVILVYLTAVDLPGKVLISTMERALPGVLSRGEVDGYPPVTKEEIAQKVVDVYEARSELLLMLYAADHGYNPESIISVRAMLFREHLLTCVQVDPEKVGRWDFIDCVVNLPWFEPYLVINNGGDPYTREHVMGLDFMAGYRDVVSQAEVVEIMRFLNGRRR